RIGQGRTHDCVRGAGSSAAAAEPTVISRAWRAGGGLNTCASCITLHAKRGEGAMAAFEAIRARAAQRKGGEAVLASLLGQAPDNDTVATTIIYRILSTRAERAVPAGFIWRVIEQKRPGLEAAFLGFQPRSLLFQQDDFWLDLASDSRIVRNSQK